MRRRPRDLSNGAITLCVWEICVRASEIVCHEQREHADREPTAGWIQLYLARRSGHAGRYLRDVRRESAAPLPLPAIHEPETAHFVRLGARVSSRSSVILVIISGSDAVFDETLEAAVQRR